MYNWRTAIIGVTYYLGDHLLLLVLSLASLREVYVRVLS